MYCIVPHSFTLALFTRNLMFILDVHSEICLTCMISCSHNFLAMSAIFKDLSSFVYQIFVINPKHREINKMDGFIQLKKGGMLLERGTSRFLQEPNFQAVVYRSSVEKTIFFACCNNSLLLFAMQYFIGIRF